jgi:hypothetical protein
MWGRGPAQRKNKKKIKRDQSEARHLVFKYLNESWTKICLVSRKDYPRFVSFKFSHL